MQSTNQFSTIRSYLLSKDWYVGLVAFCWLFMIYTEIPVPVGGGKVLPAIMLLLFVPLVWPLIKSDFRLKHLFFVAFITLIALVSLAVKLDITLLTDNFFKLLQFFYSIAMCLFTYLFISSIKYSIAQKVMLSFVIFILVGCILERIGLIRGLTESYRVVYSAAAGGGEIDQDREVSLAGFKRPYLFTSEPSVVGIGFFAFSFAFCILNNNKLKDLLVILMVFVVLQLLASPTILFALVIITPFSISKYRLSFLSVVFTGLILLVFLVGFSQIGNVRFIFDQIILRIVTELASEGNSMYLRLYVPYLITLPTVLPQYWLFGVGYGNTGYINLLFGYSFDYSSGDSVNYLGVNGFATLLVYFGVIGNILLYSAIYYLHRSNRIPWFFYTFLFMILLGQITGSIGMPRYWCYVGLCVAAFKLRAKKEMIKKQIRIAPDMQVGLSNKQLAV